VDRRFPAIDSLDGGIEMKSKLFAVMALLVFGPADMPAADVVDPALVGTWKLEWPRGDFFWAIRSDGVYRMHGPGAPSRQMGKLEAGQGRFSMKTAFWADSGVYKLSNPNTLVIAGQLGPGTWTQVWTPAKTGSQQPAGPDACGLLTADEVAHVLRGPVTAAPDPHARERESACRFESQLSSLDNVMISVRPNTDRAHFQNMRKSQGTTVVPVPDVGDEAFAKRSGGDSLAAIEFYRRDKAVNIVATLTPQATMDDLTYLADLARAVDRRLAGFTLPGPSEQTQKRLEEFEKAKAGGWKGRLPAGQTIPPGK
jgi:hypothetical protein